jgi:large subunit ribosomal protein L22
MKSYLKNYRQSPRKVRLVADAIRGKKVDVALRDLAFMGKRADGAITKLLQSALANAKNSSQGDETTLIVKEIRVDKGIVLKRIMPRARGTASRINKRSSHIIMTLAPAPEAKVKKVRKVVAKKVVPTTK